MRGVVIKAMVDCMVGGIVTKGLHALVRASRSPQIASQSV